MLIFLLLFFFLPFFIFLFILPIGYLFYGFLNFLTVPLQIIEISLNRKLRKNHALEHATISVLEEKYGRKNIFSGYARENGFYIFGSVDPDLLLASAIEGKERLLSGEKDLAIHERCGTSIAVAGFLTFILFIFLLIITHSINFFLLIFAFIIGQIVGPIFGKFIQKYFTVDTNVEDVKILDVVYNPENIFGPFNIVYPHRPSSFFVKTSIVKKFQIL